MRGFRVEPGEIETVLTAGHPAVDDGGGRGASELGSRATIALVAYTDLPSRRFAHLERTAAGWCGTACPS